MLEVLAAQLGRESDLCIKLRRWSWDINPVTRGSYEKISGTYTVVRVRQFGMAHN